ATAWPEPEWLMGGRVTRSLLRNQAAGQLCQPRDLVFNTPILELVHDLLCGTRIPIAGCANLYCGSPGEHELHDVGGSRDSSHAHHGDLYGMRHVVNHAQSNGLNGGA